MSPPELVHIRGVDGIDLVGDRWVAGNPVGTVLLLHGGGQTRHSWARTGERLAATGWTALSMDTRGHGDSGWGATPASYDLDHLLGDLKAIVAWIGEPPVAIGASMGGMTALIAGGENQGLLRAMVLVDVTPRLEPVGVEKITGFMRSGSSGFASLDEAADAVAAYNPHRDRPRNLEGLKKNVRLRPDGRWYWHWDPQFMQSEGREPDRGVMGDRPREACVNVRVPVLLVRGRQSDIVSPEGARELLELVPGSRMVDVANAGHMVAGDDNDVFTQEVEGFLASLT